MQTDVPVDPLRTLRHSAKMWYVDMCVRFYLYATTISPYNVVDIPRGAALLSWLTDSRREPAPGPLQILAEQAEGQCQQHRCKRLRADGRARHHIWVCDICHLPGPVYTHDLDRAAVVRLGAASEAQQVIDLWSGTPLNAQHRMFIDRADGSFRCREMRDAGLIDMARVEALLPLSFAIAESPTEQDG